MATQTNTQSQDMLAKLLATENINILRSNVKTAAFDIKGRTLFLPRWKEMTPVIEEALMMHEVGHALYTGIETYGVVFEEKKHLKDYANVIEDVRIEKKMKERYPGSRKSFNNGYRELNDRDFFGIKNRDLSKLLLIDRINLYFKVGYNCGVQFNAEEQEFIRRVDKCSSENDVLALAEEIFAYSKDTIKSSNEKRRVAGAPKSKGKAEESDEDEESSMFDEYAEEEESEEESEEQDGNSDGEEESEEEQDAKDSTGTSSSKQAPKEDEIDEEELLKDLAPITNKQFEEKLELLADDLLVTRYFEPSMELEYADIIVSYKKTLPVFEETLKESVISNKSRIAKFKSNSSGIVSYLVKEFEMRKSATAYKRAKISRIGQLDSRKLYAYKIKEDLFRQIMTVQDGKKHGMVFLLDWSGSMAACMDETIEQVINLAMFCQRIQIPYQVFAFTDGYTNTNDDGKVASANANGLTANVSLLELFSNRMSNVEFNRMVNYMMCSPYNRIRNYSLNGTPLNEALLFMTSYLGKFIRDNNVEKTTFITLTDGQGGALYGNNTANIKNGLEHKYNDKLEYRETKVKSYLRDPITKKEYDLTRDSSEQTALFLNVIKDRYGVKSVAFFVMDSTMRACGAFIRANSTITSASQAIDASSHIMNSLRKDKFCVLTNIPGRDEMYLLVANTKIRDDSIKNITEDMSASSIARLLGNSMNSRKSSRVVLNKFIGMVA